MAALGSSHMFSDEYLDKEENGKIMVSSAVVLFCFFNKTPQWLFTAVTGSPGSLASQWTGFGGVVWTQYWHPEEFVRARLTEGVFKDKVSVVGLWKAFPTPVHYFILTKFK